MPVEVAIWRVTGRKVKRVEYSSISSENRLEDILITDISILDDNLLIIGRQVLTSFGKRIDMLAVDGDGKLSIIELKKERTPRDVVAQAISYASWAQNLSYAEIAKIFRDQFNKDFEPVFEDKFGDPPPETLNHEHDILIVCTAMDDETERILNYLSDNYSVPINVVFFRCFKDEDNEYLSRSWFIDPNEVAEKTKSQKKSEGWNGRDFVVNIDVDDNGVSSWPDARKYGFISAGGGKWYSRTLNQLFPGARVFAMRPKKGYIGVGTVVEESKPINDFYVNENGQSKPIIDAGMKASALKNDPDDPEICEYFVRVDWIVTKESEEDAYWEKGLSANQNSAFKLRNKFTLEKLVKHFGLDE